jgi:ligand-binding sensor domain-containing protein
MARPADVGSRPIQAMTTGSDGPLWVAFFGHCVHRWHQGTWRGPDPRLPQDEARALWTDAGGAVWVGHAGNRVSRLQLHGSLPPLRPTPSAVQAGDGRLWFSKTPSA